MRNPLRTKSCRLTCVGDKYLHARSHFVMAVECKTWQRLIRFGQAGAGTTQPQQGNQSKIKVTYFLKSTSGLFRSKCSQNEKTCFYQNLTLCLLFADGSVEDVFTDAPFVEDVFKSIIQMQGQFLQFLGELQS